MDMKNKQPDRFIQRLLTLVMPIAFQQFMLALVSASDALMLGILSQDALSAVSLEAPCPCRVFHHQPGRNHQAAGGI